MKLHEIFTLDELNIDNREGLGATGYNSNVDYRGLRVQMTPITFLKLAHRLEEPVSVDYIVDYIKKGGAIGSPFLLINIPDGWWEGDFSKVARVIGHEGRNRMTAIEKVEGNTPVEVHLFFYSDREVRARHITPEIIENLKKQLRGQDGNWVVGPIFESRQLLELFNKPYDVEWLTDIKHSNIIRAQFTTDSGSTVKVTFTERENLVNIIFGTSYFDPDLERTVASFSISGTGDAPRIFATVLSVIETYCKKYNPDYIFFSAHEPSRVKLYNAMIRILSKDYDRIEVNDVAIENMKTSNPIKDFIKKFTGIFDKSHVFLLQKNIKNYTLNEVISTTSSTYKFRPIY